MEGDSTTWWHTPRAASVHSHVRGTVPRDVAILRILLTAIDSSLGDAWHRHCADLPGVEVVRGNILEAGADAVVSPANSFGFMDGGIDALYTDHFGRGLQKTLQATIKEHHHGELLVGQAELVETGDPSIPFLIAAPTMRVPMVLRDSVSPYLAARAVLLLIAHGTIRSGKYAGDPVASRVKSVALPGLGTGVGQIGPNICAHQVRVAIENVILGKAKFPRSWAEASHDHQTLYGDRTRDLQRS